MALAATKYEHIVLDDQGVPVIAGANTKVVELAEELYAYGWSPVERRFQDAEQMRRAAGASPLQRRLRSLRHRG